MKSENGRAGRVLLAVASGLLLGAGFPPVPFGYTAFVGFIPFLILLGRLEDAARVFRYSYLTFLVMNLTTVYWISGWWGEDPWLKAAGVAVNLVHPLLFTIPSLLLYRIGRTEGQGAALVLFPVLWTAFEWLAHIPGLSFPWLVLGNTMTYALRQAQFIEYTGVFGASFFICLVNVLLFRVARDWFTERKPLATRPARISAVLILVLFAAVNIHSHFRLAENDDAPAVNVGIVQPNVDPYDKWSEGETPAGKVENLMRLYDSIAAGARPDLILFPETAFPFYIRQPSYEREWNIVRSHVDSAGIPLLTGFADLRWYEGDAPASAKRVKDSDIRYETYNSTMLILPRNPLVQVYHKSRLTPLSERIPYIDVFPFLQKVLTWGVGISSWGLGNDTTVFVLPLRNGVVRTWAMICYETLYPDFIAGFVRRGAGFLAIVTNDGWFGNSSGPYQLQQYAALRAIETRRGIARCANNGISCFIDAYGRTSKITRFGARTWIAGDVHIRSDMTVYARFGDWLPKACAILAAAAIIWNAIVSLKRRNRGKQDRSAK
jgi:apolipoprotein N-acyltransferase